MSIINSDNQRRNYDWKPLKYFGYEVDNDIRLKFKTLFFFFFFFLKNLNVLIWEKKGKEAGGGRKIHTQQRKYWTQIYNHVSFQAKNAECLFESVVEFLPGILFLSDRHRISL